MKLVPEERSSRQTYEQEKVDHVAVGPLKVGPIPDQRHDDRLDGVARQSGHVLVLSAPLGRVAVAEFLVKKLIKGGRHSTR